MTRSLDGFRFDGFATYNRAVTSEHDPPKVSHEDDRAISRRGEGFFKGSTMAS